MPYNFIDFVSRNTAENTAGDRNTIVISISDSCLDAARLNPGFHATLFLKFDNIEHLMGRYIRFSKQHADEILDFVRRHQDSGVTDILVHCTMGQSRSAAVALFLKEKYGLELNRPTNEHNKWVYRVLKKIDERPKVS